MPPFRKHLADLTPYTSARDEFAGQARIYLDANENSHAVWAPHTFRYPDPHHKALRHAIADYLGVSPDETLCGCGSDEIIDWLIRAVCEPHTDCVLTIEPSYGVYETYARIHGASVCKVPLEPDFSLRADTLLKALTPHTRVIFLCSPNNPTGNVFEPQVLSCILEAFPGWVVLDEAYVDFAENPTFWLERRHQYDNLVLLRTFSKAWGLAGWRIGYAIAPPSLVSLFYRTKLPYNLATPAQHAAIQVLARREEVARTIVQIKAERTRLMQALAALPMVERVFPSEANFLLVRFRHSARWIYEALLRQGIVTRYRGNLPGCAETLRITIGTPEENNLLLSALCAISSLTATEP